MLVFLQVSRTTGLGKLPLESTAAKCTTALENGTITFVMWGILDTAAVEMVRILFGPTILNNQTIPSVHLPRYVRCMNYACHRLHLKMDYNKESRIVLRTPIKDL